mmetsp:Transcript_12675/g.29248  ORF Transcript_12675/g.29248 Transcript_12675/m.29248 type:complete len:440 (+) Transcript_12675:806-2125(+)
MIIPGSHRKKKTRMIRKKYMAKTFKRPLFTLMLLALSVVVVVAVVALLLVFVLAFVSYCGFVCEGLAFEPQAPLPPFVASEEQLLEVLAAVLGAVVAVVVVVVVVKIVHSVVARCIIHVHTHAVVVVHPSGIVRLKLVWHLSLLLLLLHHHHLLFLHHHLLLHHLLLHQLVSVCHHVNVVVVVAVAVVVLHHHHHHALLLLGHHVLLVVVAIETLFLLLLLLLGHHSIHRAVVTTLSHLVHCLHAESGRLLVLLLLLLRWRKQRHDIVVGRGRVRRCRGFPCGGRRCRRWRGGRSRDGRDDAAAGRYRCGNGSGRCGCRGEGPKVQQVEVFRRCRNGGRRRHRGSGCRRHGRHADLHLGLAAGNPSSRGVRGGSGTGRGRRSAATPGGRASGWRFRGVVGDAGKGGRIVKLAAFVLVADIPFPGGTVGVLGRFFPSRLR